ncbi:isoprenylcysteine carboxylmethyltransferase family protein [Bradyrhizobium denitrificans]|uniref:Isoprenylcysteine carboxylmethyltransferase family protein n=1 Tax=Bradyrhizobium denitrificans TaxID=2734912 RepID=A0ABS5G2B5_9BRAD|nr:isoprenylcysteine carboxylmethyltransferase family protein [Bradyrhizobium denitrificans]NPU20318.1 isoprenylcysteine carboxylmethyltransferase family protein [Bradyrhizobium sp. LMG 8443]
MSNPADLSHLTRLTALLRSARAAPPGAGRIATAVLTGLVCHALFALAVLAMIGAMFFGMSESFGRVPWPWAIVANTALLLQFPLVHSLLLGPGRRWLARLGQHGATLATTHYAVIAALQLLCLFALWTPSGIVWWRAQGGAFVALCLAYATSWLLLIKASWDAGVEVQSGALGWLSLAADRPPRFPDMPERGLFAIIRQPIYLAFALSLWTVPVWTPDQLAVALMLTAYCLLAPRLKERRFAQIYGARFRAYRARVPYILPRWPAGGEPTP